MKNSEFDSWLKNKMDELAKAYQNREIFPPEKTDWNTLEQKIKSINEQSQFDFSIVDKLHSATVFSTEANWNSFQLRIQEDRDRKRKIFRTRLAEALVLIILFWISDHTFVKKSHDEIKNKSGKAEYAGIEIKDILSTDVAESEKKFQKIITDEKASKIEHSEQKTNLESVNKRIKSVKNRVSELGIYHKHQPRYNNRVKINDSVNSDSNEFISNSILVVNKNLNQLFDTIHKVVTTNSRFDNDSIRLIDKINETATNLSEQVEKLNSSEIDQESTVNFKILPKPQKESKRIFWLTGGTGISLLSIKNNSQDTSYILNKRYKSTSFYKSINVNLDFNVWILESGLKFYHIRFQPGNYIAYNQLGESFTIEQIKKIDYSMMEIPIVLHRKMYSSDKLDLTLFGGLSIAICNKADYEIIKPTNGGVSTIYYDPNDQIKLIVNEYNRGINVDKSLSGNAFTNINFGMRSKVKVLNYFHLTADIAYSKMLEPYGFGPLGNKISNISFGLGARYSFK